MGYIPCSCSRSGVASIQLSLSTFFLHFNRYFSYSSIGFGYRRCWFENTVGCPNYYNFVGPVRNCCYFGLSCFFKYFNWIVNWKDLYFGSVFSTGLLVVGALNYYLLQNSSLFLFYYVATTINIIKKLSISYHIYFGLVLSGRQFSFLIPDNVSLSSNISLFHLILKL